MTLTEARFPTRADAQAFISATNRAAGRLVCGYPSFRQYGQTVFWSVWYLSPTVVRKAA